MIQRYGFVLLECSRCAFMARCDKHITLGSGVAASHCAYCALVIYVYDIRVCVCDDWLDLKGLYMEWSSQLKVTLTKLIAEVWKHGNIARKKTDGAQKWSSEYLNRPHGYSNLFGWLCGWMLQIT